MSKLIDIIERPLTGEWGEEDTVGNGILVLRTTNFTNEGHIDYSNVVTRKIDRTRVSDKYLYSGDIIIEKSGGSTDQPVGRVVYFDGEPNKYVVNNFTSILRIKHKHLTFPRYLFYFLFANYKQGQTKKYQNKTTGISNLKLDRYIKDTNIFLPSLETQRKIAKTLDTVSKILVMRKQQLTELDNLIKSTFYDMFGDPVTNERGWEIFTLNDVCRKITDGTHHSPQNFSEGKYMYVTAKNIRKDGLDFDNITYVTEEDHKSIFSRCAPEFGDVLYIKDGVTTGIAQVNILKEEFSLLSSVALLKPNANLINSYFLREVLNNDKMYSSIRNNMGGAAITRLTLRKIGVISIPLPPLSLQKEFAETLSTIEEQMSSIKLAIKETQYLFDSLMSSYFD